MKSHSAVLELLLVCRLEVTCFIIFDPKEVCVMKQSKIHCTDNYLILRLRRFITCGSFCYEVRMKFAFYS